MGVVISKISHQGKEIMVLENDQPTHDEAVEGFHRAKEAILAEPDDSVLIIVEASRSGYYGDVSDMWKQSSPELNKKVVKAAVVTESFPVRLAVKAFLVFTRTMKTVPFRDVQVFKSMDQAKDWLIMPDVAAAEPA